MGSSLRVIQDFTSDPAVLRQVVATLKTGASPYMENAAGGPVHAWFEGMPWPSEAVKERVILFQQQTESNLVDQRVEATMGNFRMLIHALAGYPGRKNVLWVSEAFPLTITGVKYMGSPQAQEANRTYGAELAQTTRCPTCQPSTPGPTASMTPASSCPKIAGGRIMRAW